MMDTAEKRAAPWVLREDRSGVAHLTLNRPAQFNPLSLGMLQGLQSHLDEIAPDPAIRVVVLGAAGRAFCPGHDLKEMLASRDEVWIARLFDTCSRMMLTLMRMPQPVIARVHGVATAAGCQLVAACDLAVAADTARFATSGIDYGLFCATPAVPLSRVIGRKHALEMLLTGEFIDAATAQARGLVNRVVAPEALDDAIEALCRVLLAKPPKALAEGKQFFHRQIGLDMEMAYAQAGALLTRQVLGDEGHEGLTAFSDKRPPAWRD